MSFLLGGPDQRDIFQPFSTNMLIVVVVCGIIIVAIVCATIYFIARNRRRQREEEADLSLLAELTSTIISPLESPIIWCNFSTLDTGAIEIYFQDFR